jgi:hypothetical protein
MRRYKWFSLVTIVVVLLMVTMWYPYLAQAYSTDTMNDYLEIPNLTISHTETIPYGVILDIRDGGVPEPGPGPFRCQIDMMELITLGDNIAEFEFKMTHADGETYSGLHATLEFSPSFAGQELYAVIENLDGSGPCSDSISIPLSPDTWEMMPRLIDTVGSVILFADDESAPFAAMLDDLYPSALPENGVEYVIQPGDSLWDLAGADWPAVWLATNDQASIDTDVLTITNPDILSVGQTVWIPDGIR